MAKLYIVIRRYFFAGLLTLLPLWVTYVLLKTLFSFVVRVAKPLIPTFPHIIEKRYIVFIVDLASVFVVIVLVWLIGFLATKLIGKKFLGFFESLLKRVPLVSTIYFTIRRITNTLTSDRSKFQSVVLVPFPTTGSYAIGFVTSEGSGVVQKKTKEHVINIFLPTTPNPTSGYLLMVDRDKVIPLDMSIDEAVKMVITFGIASEEQKDE